jgi:hypothetical protein
VRRSSAPQGAGKRSVPGSDGLDGSGTPAPSRNGGGRGDRRWAIGTDRRREITLSLLEGRGVPRLTALRGAEISRPCSSTRYDTPSPPARWRSPPPSLPSPTPRWRGDRGLRGLRTRDPSGRARPTTNGAAVDRGSTAGGVRSTAAPCRPPRSRRSEACRARKDRFRLVIAYRCTGPFCRLAWYVRDVLGFDQYICSGRRRRRKGWTMTTDYPS